MRITLKSFPIHQKEKSNLRKMKEARKKCVI